MYNRLCCPQCGNEDLQAVTETNTLTTGKNYSAGQGCLGFLLLGPLGLLCGSCGQHQKTTTVNNTYWVCPKCGKKFRNPDDLRHQINENKKFIPIAFILDIIATLCLIFIFIACEMDIPQALLIGFVVFAVLFCMIVFAKQVIKKQEKELKEIEDGMKKFIR